MDCHLGAAILVSGLRHKYRRTQVSPHPNDNPSLTKAADLTAVATMSLHPHASTITRQLPALRTASRPKLFNRWRPRTSRAQVLDGIARPGRITTAPRSAGGPGPPAPPKKTCPLTPPLP